jgi:MFS family permease
LVSLGAGFINSQIPLIVLRAFGGVFAALTIPSALTLLVNVFPDEEEQARAIGIFGGSGAVANVLGLIIGAIFVEYANWRWVFWFATIIALPVAAMCALLVPKQVATGDRIQPSREKLRRLDIPGVSTLTCALILFIFAVTSGSTAGWKSAMVLAPLFISVALIAAFLVWQTRVPEKYAAVYVLFLLLFSLPTGY